MPKKLDLAKREVWRRRLRDFARGDSTVTEFCRRMGVPVWSFYYWQQRLRSGTTKTSSDQARHGTVTRCQSVPTHSLERDDQRGELVLDNKHNVAHSFASAMRVHFERRCGTRSLSA